MGEKNKGYIICLLCYSLWGILPAYWNLLAGVNQLFVLCCRIVFAFCFAIVLLVVYRRLGDFLSMLRDKAAMRYLIPASILIALNWGLYLWAVTSGYVLDCSLGYYMNPLIAFLLGVLVFREKYSKLQLVAVGLAVTGVIISLIAFGSFPYISIGLALSFAVYGVLKKKVKAEPVASIAVESFLVAPFSVVLALFLLTGSVRPLNITDILLLAGGGVVTAMPLLLYAKAVNAVPFIIVGFFQYISPSLTLIYGLLTGETPSESQLVSFVFIGLGLIVFSIALVRTARAEAAAGALQ